MPFAKATKKAAKLRLALTGPSSSGKTYSMLRVATGIVKAIGGKIAVLDTERKSASLYADMFDFLVCDIDPPYTCEKYIAALKEAESIGATVTCPDSLSHAWAGEGGLLEKVDSAQQKGGNKFTAWGPATKQQNALINALLATEAHLICTLRSKQEYALEVGADGKQKVKKVGLGPVQRDGVEYEFSTVLYLDMDNMASVGSAGKDRTGLFKGQEPHVLTEDDGRAIVAWINSTANGTHAKVREEVLPILQKAAGNGLESLQQAWESVGKEARLSLKEDLPALKEMAAKAVKPDSNNYSRAW